MAERDEFGAFLVGFLVGAVAGGVTALLLAPQSGEETRTLIRDKSIELRDKAQVSAQDAMRRAEEAAEEARTWASQAVGGKAAAVEVSTPAPAPAAKSSKSTSG